jgi:hypothetical protein
MKTQVYFTGMGSGSVPRQGASRQSGSGGGARVVERSAPKAEPRSYGMSPEGVAQYGTAQGNHVTGDGGKTVQGGVKSIVGGAGYEAVGPTRSVPGPGGGRTVQHCGSQHGLVRDPEPQRSSHNGWEIPPGQRR